MIIIHYDRVFCSWSGGKDSCLALHKAIEMGSDPRYLLTMFANTGDLSRSHGLRQEIIEAQADSLGIPLISPRASWQEYETVFISMLQQLKSEGIEAGVFGDIDIQEHRDWEQQVCSRAGLQAILPLWQQERSALVAEFIDLGYRAWIVSAREDLADLLGRQLDRKLLDELRERQIDPCGEMGEYHSVVVDGPMFRRPVPIQPGQICLRDGYAFLDFQPK